MNEINMNNTAEAQSVQTPYVALNPTVVAASKRDTEYSNRMKDNYKFFGPVTLLYAAFYAFCMFQNGSGITFPFFVVGSLLYLCFSLSKLEISLQKNSGFYMVSMMLLAVSTFCTDDLKIIGLNKTGIFFLMMSLLLQQFYDTSKWKLGKYLRSILELVFCSMGELGRPFSDKKHYDKKRGERNKTVGYVLWGLVISIPLLMIVLGLLGSADVVFREITDDFFDGINFGNIFNVLFRIGFIFFASYSMLAYLCKKSIKEEVGDYRKGEPILAITITSLLSVVYILFSGIQIVYLFLGRMELPKEYTYAAYAREGFFQLLTVSVLNLIIVLVMMSYFKESNVLKIVLTVMSLCTFVMIASSALRMIMYIRYYYMTFLRIFVLWALVVLFLMFVGVIVSVFKESFPLFKYSMVVITVLYIGLSFSHPDFIIAKINVANISVTDTSVIERTEEDFFQTTAAYHDFHYLSNLSADAAPVLIPYMKEEGYHLSAFYAKDLWEAGLGNNTFPGRNTAKGFGFYYLEKLKSDYLDFNWRTYNISRHMALKNIEKCAK